MCGARRPAGRSISVRLSAGYYFYQPPSAERLLLATIQRLSSFACSLARPSGAPFGRQDARQSRSKKTRQRSHLCKSEIAQLEARHSSPSWVVFADHPSCTRCWPLAGGGQLLLGSLVAAGRRVCSCAPGWREPLVRFASATPPPPTSGRSTCAPLDVCAAPPSSWPALVIDLGGERCRATHSDPARDIGRRRREPGSCPRRFLVA